MSVTQASDPNDPTGTTPIFYSSVTGQSYGTAADAHAAEASMSGASLLPAQPAAPPAPASGRDPDLQSKVDQATANEQIYNTKTGVYRPMTDAERVAAQTVASQTQAGAAPANPAADAMATADQTIAKYSPQPALSQAQIMANAGAARGATTPGLAASLPANGSARLTGTGYTPGTAGVVTQASAPGTTATAGGVPSAAPKVDTTASDKAVAGVNSTIQQLLNLSNNAPKTSVAESQLLKADQLAKIRDQQALQQNEAAALGAARSGNRRDMALNERQAIGESTYLGQADQRNQVLQQAELEGNLAAVRAQEDQTNFTNRANILSKAADLGLNVAGLQTDISKANLGAATDYMNNEFQQLGLDKQLDQQKAQSALSYMQAMSAIQFDYDKMSDADKEHTRDLLMQQYGIDKAEESALAQIKANKKLDWGQFLAQAALGGIAGTSAIAAAGAGKK